MQKISLSNCSFFRYSQFSRAPSPDWPYLPVIFRVQRPDWPHQFLTMPNQKNFDQLLIFVNLCQHAKNEAVSSTCSGEIVDLKILQSDWLRTFLPIPQEQDFSQI